VRCPNWLHKQVIGARGSKIQEVHKVRVAPRPTKYIMTILATSSIHCFLFWRLCVPVFNHDIDCMLLK
jgi:hypothetical protein